MVSVCPLYYRKQLLEKHHFITCIHLSVDIAPLKLVLYINLNTKKNHLIILYHFKLTKHFITLLFCL